MPTKKRAGSRRDELRPEYNLTGLRGGVRGKCYGRAQAGTNLVLIEPEIAEVFPNGEAVNNALRRLVRSSNGHGAKRVHATPRVRSKKPRSARS